jgi:hypothetical protein
MHAYVCPLSRPPQTVPISFTPRLYTKPDALPPHLSAIILIISVPMGPIEHRWKVHLIISVPMGPIEHC